MHAHRSRSAFLALAVVAGSALTLGGLHLHGEEPPSSAPQLAAVSIGEGPAPEGRSFWPESSVSVVDDLDYLPDPTDSGAHDNGQAPVEMRTARADVDRDPLNYGSDPFPHFQPAPIQLPVEAKSISGLTR